MSGDWQAIDPGVRRYVRILHESGVETFQSCAGTGAHGDDGKAPNERHAYTEPTIEFHGTRAAGFHALKVAMDHGFPVAELRRIWKIQDGEPVGPYWAMTFFACDVLVE